MWGATGNFNYGAENYPGSNNDNEVKIEELKVPKPSKCMQCKITCCKFLGCIVKTLCCGKI